MRLLGENGCFYEAADTLQVDRPLRVPYPIKTSWYLPAQALLSESLHSRKSFIGNAFSVRSPLGKGVKKSLVFRCARSKSLYFGQFSAI